VGACAGGACAKTDTAATSAVAVTRVFTTRTFEDVIVNSDEMAEALRPIADESAQGV
jgi:hypothetical protein